MIKRLSILIGLLLTLATPAFAQSGCGNNATPPLSGGGSVFGSIVSQWIQYFAQKIDVNNGVACNITLNGIIGGTAFPINPANGGTGVNNGVNTLTSVKLRSFKPKYMNVIRPAVTIITQGILTFVVSSIILCAPGRI